MHPFSRTWRVRGVPPDFDEKRLADTLRDHPDLQCPNDGTDNGICVRTLAPDPEFSQQVATIRFRNLPGQLKALESKSQLTVHIPMSQENPPAGAKRKRGSQQIARVTIDEQFDDITVLSSPSTDEDHHIDVLAISGLGSHPFGSFVHKGDGHMWLSDSLPQDLPTARVMIYGYESRLQRSTSVAHLDDFAGSLQITLSRLLRARKKRLVLIGHSLGGLLIKEAFIRIAESDYESDLIDLIFGVLFFGTPNDGMDIESLVPMVDNQPNRSFLESLNATNSQILRLQKRDLVKFARYDAEYKKVAHVIQQMLQRSLGPVNTANSKGAYKIDEMDYKCLNDLRTTDPRNDKTRIEQAKGGLLADSYRWILDNADFHRWRDNPQSRLLWIKGDPGKGKTMLLCGIIDELKKSPADTRLLSFFFCQAPDARINNAAAVLRGLIYMLVDQQPALISHMRKKYDCAGKDLFQDVNAWVALSEIFADILQDPSLRNTYLVVDALDECVASLPQLLDLIIQKSSASPRVKWIVSSRNWPDIEEQLERAGQKVRLCLELNEKSISAAVSTYISHRVDRLAQLKKYNSRIQDAVQDHLSSNAKDTFLWVALVCQELEKILSWNTLAKLTAFPPGLDPLYMRMMEQVCNSDGADLCKRVLSVVAVVYRPITLEELTSLVDEMELYSDHLAEIIGSCGSFLTLRERKIYFVHQSAKDFLLTKASGDIFPLGMGEGHHAVFSRSLRIMDRDLRRDMYSLVAPGYPIDQVEEPEPDPLATARYSCVYWVDHLCEWQSSKSTKHADEPRDGGDVDAFVRQKYLYWLEALSLLRSMSEGVLSMAKLEGLVQGKAEAPQLIDLVRDAFRFIRYFKWPIQNSPLQVYASALIFSPARSLTRSLFKKEEPEWITTKPVMEDNWDACLQTLEGHTGWVNSVTFSPDDTHIASASSDTTVKIWATKTGQCLQTLESHSEKVNSVAFSPDGTHIASASNDTTVKIWTTTGQCLQTLEGHSGFVRSVAFSPDGTYIASSSADTTVKIWATKTGQCLQTLEGHSNYTTSVTFSPDGTHIASVSSDTTVKIWATKTGQCLQTLESQSEQVNSVAFSPDGTCLLSSGYRTVKIWKTTGQCLQTLEANNAWVEPVLARPVRSAAFSPDGTHLVSALSDDTIEIWKMTGQCLKTVEGHRGLFEPVTFSSDGTYIASASNGNTVKIWTTTGQCLQTLEGHSGFVMSIAFSSDGTYIASSSNDTTVKIWVTTTGQYLRTLNGHRSGIDLVAISSDGMYIASASDDATVKIWATKTGQCLQTLEGHSDRVMSVAFSPDGAYVISGSSDLTIKIWAKTTGQCLQTLEGHTGLVTLVAFSPDGTHIASASSHTTVKIWAKTTGQCLQTFEGHSGFVMSAVFSPDGSYVAAASSNTIEIWAITTGWRSQRLIVRGLFNSLSFDPTGCYLRTSRGTILLDEPPSTSNMASTETVPREPCWRGYGISEDCTWITWNGVNVLWLPSEYRSYRSDTTHMGSTVAIGCSTGRVLFFRFSAGGIPLY